MAEKPKRRFGAIRRDGLRHAVYNGLFDVTHSSALCDYSLNVAWCEPLQPSQPTCKREPCKRYAEEARSTQPQEKGSQ